MIGGSVKRGVGRSGLVVLATMAVLGLATACAPSSPEPTRTTHSSSAAPAAATPTSPRFAIAIGCAGLLHLDEVQAHIAVPVKLDVDESTPEVVDLPLAQAGGLTCIWGGSDRTDGGYGQGVQLRALSDASADYAAWQASNPRDYCTAGTAPAFCTVDFLVGSTRIELDLKDLTSADSADPKTTAKAVEDLIAHRLSGASARSTWSPPASSLRPISDCAAATARAATVLGVEAGALHATDDAIDPATRLSQYGATQQRVGASSCAWQNPADSASLSWDVLPGGSWAFAGFDRPQQLGLVTGFRRVTVPGADEAWIACADSCVALLGVNHSFVTMYTDYGLDDATLVARSAAAIGAFSAGN